MSRLLRFLTRFLLDGDVMSDLNDLIPSDSGRLPAECGSDQQSWRDCRLWVPERQWAARVPSDSLQTSLQWLARSMNRHNGVLELS
jgi:hypothetical protein